MIAGSSRIGYDVDTASDKQLSFSSDWQLLPIEYEGSYQITEDDVGTILPPYLHGLGYPPVYMSWIEDPTGNIYGADPFYLGATNCTSTEIIFNRGQIIYDDSYVGWIIHWKVFRRSLLTEYTALNINVADATKEIDNDNGIIVSLVGKDTNSTDDRDFGIRSDRRQLMIHKSGVTGYTVVDDLNFTASSSSSGNTLVSTTSTFDVEDVGRTLYNTIDDQITIISEYVNSTTVIVSDTIGDTWDGDNIVSTGYIQRAYHGLRYSPMFLAFYNVRGSGQWGIFANADDSHLSVDNDYITFEIVYPDYRFSYLIFKDTLVENG